jgi:hypothetical protein
MSDWDANGEPVPVSIGPAGKGSNDRPTGATGRPSPDEAADLADLVGELAGTLRELRTEVDDGARGRRSTSRDSPELPQPPSPRDLLRFTERYTIPTAVAFLEAAIRALELLAGAIRLLDGRDPRAPERRDDGDGAVAALSTAAGERAAETGREALARVDDALAELQRSYEGEPEDPTARRLLADARALREDIDDRLVAAERDREAGAGRRDAAREDDEEKGGSDDGGDRPTVDVDAELASLREQAGRDGDEGDEA